MNYKPRCLSIYTGAGGLDLGFEKAGFQIVGATDVEPICKATYDLNQSEVPFRVGEAKDYSADYFEEYIDSNNLNDLTCLIGGPPCPSFSKSRFYRKEKPRAMDDSNADETIKGYLHVLKTFRPKYFVLENVKGLTYKVHQTALAYILESAASYGYAVDVWSINAADYGVPQIRERSFVVGGLTSVPLKPSPTHANRTDSHGLFETIKPWVSVRDVLMDLDTAGVEEIPGHFAGKTSRVSERSAR